MNREETNETLERCRRFGTEMEAFGQGIAIQVKAPSGWVAEFTPSWNFHCEYRIKPKPLECWINVLEERICSTSYSSKNDAVAVLHNNESLSTRWTTRKFREVIE